MQAAEIFGLYIFVAIVNNLLLIGKLYKNFLQLLKIYKKFSIINYVVFRGGMNKNWVMYKLIEFPYKAVKYNAM